MNFNEFWWIFFFALSTNFWIFSSGALKTQRDLLEMQKKKIWKNFLRSKMLGWNFAFLMIFALVKSGRFILQLFRQLRTRSKYFRIARDAYSKVQSFADSGTGGLGCKQVFVCFPLKKMLYTTYYFLLILRYSGRPAAARRHFWPRRKIAIFGGFAFFLCIPRVEWTKR